MSASLVSRQLLAKLPRSLRSSLSPTRLASATTTTTTTRLLTQTRHSSDLSHLESELSARKIPISYDYLAPTPSHLLNIALTDVFAPYVGGSGDNPAARVLPSTTQPTQLPPGQHLVYFPPAIPGPELLPDGTDPLQSPGEPFVRRMWAGGAVRWNNSPAGVAALALDGARVACIEAIKDVSVKGKPGDEKIFVGIERRVGRCTAEDEGDASLRSRLLRDDEADFGDAAVVERRNIVFMRERSKEQAVQDMEKARAKQLSPPAEGAQIAHSLVPDAKLLFRFSALTYNAHAIHLDTHYCREVEGHRDLLVHGPLSFTMLMTLLRVHLAKYSKGTVVKSVEYRNLAPLYCNEPLKLAGREKEPGKWEMWAETPEGGLAVKGTIVTEEAQSDRPGDIAMLGL